MDFAAAAIRKRRILKNAGVRRRARRPNLPRQRQPNALRLRYYRSLRLWLDQFFRLTEKRLVPELERVFRAAVDERTDSTRIDGKRHGQRLLKELVAKVAKEAVDTTRSQLGELESLAGQYAAATSRFQKKELVKQLRAAVGVDVFQAETWLPRAIDAFTRENVSLIVLLPETYFGGIQDKLLEKMETGLRPELIAKNWEGYYREQLAPELADREGIAKRRALRLANDQVGKFFASVNQARQEELGVDSYIWRTSRDGSVREEHRERDGLVFKWSDPPGADPDDASTGGHPGRAVHCRCYAEPDLSAILGAMRSAETG